ncbi:MAG TPA: 2-succinyl-5-enolpyruvyl-6-hydroxy-3-cyclohexene-1-carboxylic-acid synthase [Ktedonobacter sp.]|nr:2-succinyl-5-enolpyruvyl-6-hydroxy-3-cyclohexene-1-carboxylic-acid synthase [Ktedonobacter sp.]
MQLQEQQEPISEKSLLSPLLRDAANPLYAYVCAFIDELRRAGVQHVVVCPGSRSTPLALACAAQPGLRVWMQLDERSAAFFALGMAKRVRQPVALICTSGTAAANFLPAIVEAKLSHIPLLVLTADRPHELRDNGAPQTIDQNRLYGTHVKWFVEMALPEATNAALRYARTIADRAVANTLAIPAGPVHLNFPLREPLTPAPLADAPLPSVEQRDPVAWYGRSENAPYTRVEETPQSAPDETSIEDLMARIQYAPHGLVIVGPHHHDALTEPLIQLAARLGYPILADPLSQLRCGEHDKTHILSSYDAFLRLDEFASTIQPDFVLRFGAMPTSKPVLTYLKRYPTCPIVVVDGNEGWNEPTQLASDILHTDPVAFCHALLHVPDFSTQGDNERQQWFDTWQRADGETRRVLSAQIETFPHLFEGRVFTELASLLPEQATLYVGNSMPVRDLDTFFWNSEHLIHMMGNRGANGIDGVNSSALGASAVNNEPTVLVIGDLSFLHDIGGLLAAKLHGLDLTIILVNNDGGGIFSFLPQADYPDHFEQLFGTPTGVDACYAVQMYGGTYQRVEDWEQFRVQVKQSMDNGGLHVIEVRTEREENVQMHRALWKQLGSLSFE